MKNLTKVLIIFGILLVPFIVKAEVYTCSSGGYSCTFDSGNRTVTCQDPNGKGLTVEKNIFSEIELLELKKWERGIGASWVEQKQQPRFDIYFDEKRCPDYMYTATTKANKVKFIFFVDNARFYFKDVDGVTDVIHTYNEIADKVSGTYIKKFIGYSQQTMINANASCGDDIRALYNSIMDKQNRYMAAQCQTNQHSSNCQKIITEWQEDINKADQMVLDYRNNNDCMSLMNSTGLMTKLTESKEFIQGAITTTTQPKTEKQYDFSNAGCPLGEEVTKDLSGALKVMKILAPIFVFVYTVYDTIVALTHGDAEAEGKKMVQKFLKRMAAALALFAIPVLIDVLMQLFNVWDNTGHCTFVEPELVSPTDKYNDCMTQCKNEGRADQECATACSEAIKS